MKRVYTEEERYNIQRVMEKVYELLETTSNDVFFDIGRFGVHLDAYDGPVSSEKHMIIDDAVYGPFTTPDADRMISQLNVLGYFNKEFSDTKQSTADQDDAPEKEL